MPDLPSGLVTFLFTDVEGSTRLVRALGDAGWAALLQAHRELLSTAISAHGGHEVGAQGDALFAVFTKPTDASAAAIAAQIALETHAWPEGSRVRVRMGLHSGEAVAHGDNYVGKEVHRASRICDVGHGGQIVVSERTAALLRGSLPGDVTLTGLGEHRLKDMGDPEPLFQLTAPSLAREFPRLRSLDAPSSLPAVRSSFIGRERELADVNRLIRAERMVTLTGIGGSGKTRIATEVGARALAHFPEGVFFVDLAPLSDADLVVQATAAACSSAIGDILRGEFGGSLEDRLLSALAARSPLLIIDNCEHLIDEVAGLLDRVLVECPNVRVLATSREALGIDGEHVVPVPSLAIPSDAIDASAAERSDAVQLFLERAKAQKPAFVLTPDNLDAVVEICRRLDGIPLAIELAATRIAHLSARQIADRLEDRFRLLAGGRRRIQRQQTLGATLDWSYDLLGDEERIMLRRLAVFAGGFTLEAVESISSGDGIAEGLAVDLLGALVAKSLVVAGDDAGGETRYQLLETVRMYASDKLAASGEAERMRTRHRDWYLAWLESIPLERLAASPKTLHATAIEIDNLRAAADWSTSIDEPEHAARIAVHLQSYWESGPYREGRRRLYQALGAAERLSVEQRLRCHSAIARLAGTGLEREEGCKQATLAIELAEGRPSPYLALALANRGFLTSILASAPGMPESLAAESRRDCRAAIEMARRGPHEEWIVQATSWCAMAELTFGDAEAAAARFGEVLAIIANYDEPHAFLDQALAGLAVSHHLLGHDDAALSAAIDALALLNLRPRGVSTFMVLYSAEVVPALVVGGQHQVASDVLREQIGRVRRAGIPLAENHVLGIAAVREHLLGRPDRAGRLLSASRTIGGAKATEIPFRTPASVSLYRHYLPAIRAALGKEQARRARDEGASMSLDTALAYALEGLD
jgi:predicted ATPase/class 3 adenylate cyclase